MPRQLETPFVGAYSIPSRANSLVWAWRKKSDTPTTRPRKPSASDKRGKAATAAKARAMPIIAAVRLNIAAPSDLLLLLSRYARLPFSSCSYLVPPPPLSFHNIPKTLRRDLALDLAGVTRVGIIHLLYFGPSPLLRLGNPKTRLCRESWLRSSS